MQGIAVLQIAMCAAERLQNGSMRAVKSGAFLCVVSILLCAQASFVEHPWEQLCRQRAPELLPSDEPASLTEDFPLVV